MSAAPVTQPVSAWIGEFVVLAALWGASFLFMRLGASEFFVGAADHFFVVRKTGSVTPRPEMWLASDSALIALTAASSRFTAFPCSTAI